MAEFNREEGNLPLQDIFRPWELSGEARYDCEPHRAKQLAIPAYISIVAGIASLICFYPALVGLPLGLVVWSMARQDLDRIAAGDMDHNGYHPTERVRSNARAGVILSIMGTVWCGLPMMFLTFCHAW